jgi:Histidine kinase-, DNA gyrase B-, and HSP90-like ATPase
LRVRYARDMATVEIEDTGPGLSESELAQIFEPFERGQAQSGVAGSGLGLTISKMLTNLMGGELTVRSAVGQGSVFSVKLFLPTASGLDGAGGGAALANPRVAKLAAEQALEASTPVHEIPPVLPSASALASLMAVADSGHYRGLVNMLDAVALAEPACAPFIGSLHHLAQGFQLDLLQRRLAEASARVREAALSTVPDTPFGNIHQ